MRNENKFAVVIDSGDLFSNSKKPVEFRSKILCQATSSMKYDAINIGDGELDAGISLFDQALKKYKLPFVSANISIKDQDSKMIKPYIIKSFKGLKVGITGGTPPSYFVQQDSLKTVADFSDLNVMLPERVKEMKKQGADIVVVMLHMGKEASENYLEYNDTEGITIAIAGHGRSMTYQPKKIKGVHLVQNSTEGEYLGVLRVVLDEKKKPVDVKLENIALTDKYPDDPEMAKLYKEFRKEVPVTDEH